MQNYLYTQRQDNNPINAFIQGWQGGQSIMGNRTQQQMIGLKNQMLQEEYAKQQAVKNAMSKYGTPEFKESEIMAADPEMGLKLATLKKQMTADQLKLYSTGMEVFEKTAPGLVNNPQLYHQTQQRLASMGIDLIPPITHFMTKDGQIDVNAMNDGVKRMSVGPKLWLEQEKAGMEPPKSRTIEVGDKKIYQEFNPSTRQWTAVAEAPRWNDNPMATITRTNEKGETETVQIGGKPGAAGDVNPKPAQADIYKKLMGHEEDSAKISDIIRGYNPKYQTYGGKAWGILLGVWDKIDPNNITEEQDKYLRGFAAHKAETYKILNNMLNRLSGAAVTEHEMRRLTQQMPTPGTGILDGDSPRDFQSKLMAFKRDNDLAIARYTKWAKEGVIPQNKQQLNELAKKTTLDDMDRLLKNRANQVANDIVRQNPQLTDDQVKAMAAERVRREYNLK